MEKAASVFPEAEPDSNYGDMRLATSPPDSRVFQKLSREPKDRLDSDLRRFHEFRATEELLPPLNPPPPFSGEGLGEGVF